MKLIYTAILIPVLGLFAAGCTPNASLQSSESDDLYYSSADRTNRVDYVAPASGGSGSEVAATNPDEVSNPDYATGTVSGSSDYVTNNYNYYDSDYGYSRSYRNRNYRYNSYSNYGYFYDPFYAPFGYSAAYCYGVYDPFWYPGYYPYSGLTISVGYGWGYPSYGYGYGYGFSPYGYYDRGYGYYRGFYDGYYAGNGYGSGYGYGYHRTVNYAPRGNRSNVPVNAPAGGAAGRPAQPGRIADPNQPGRIMEGGRPMRTTTSQPGAPAPGREGRPGNNVPASQPAINRDQLPVRPQREQVVRPENYQFQQQDRPAQPTLENNNRPIRVRDAEQPSYQNNQPQPVRENTPAVQPERPVRPERGERRSIFQSQPQQRQQPVQENYSRPNRSIPEMRNNDGGGRFERPSFQNNAPSNGGFGRPSGGMGRPRN